MDQFHESLRFIKEAPRDLYYIYGINTIVSFQFYLLTTMVPVYFTRTLDTSDTQAGLIFGGVGVGIGIVSLLLGSLVDSIGVKHALSMCGLFSAIGYSIMCSTYSVILNLIGLLLFQTVSIALAWPVVELGVKQFTQKAAWNTSNSLQIVCNYSAGIVAGILINSLWEVGGNNDEITRAIYGIGALSGAATIALAALLDMQHGFEEEVEEELSSARQMVQARKFKRYVALIALLVLLRSGCFGHMDATFPKYILRNGSGNFGWFLALHSLSMLVGTLGFTPLTFIYSSYSLIVCGGAVGCAATFLLLTGLPLNSILFVVIMSLGESLLVPRLLDYTLKIAPVHHEATYLALCNCPFYFGMILTGFESGVLLDWLCSGEDNGETCSDMWLIIGLGSTIFPLLLIALRKWLEEPKLDVPLIKKEMS